MSKDLVDGLVALCGIGCVFLLVLTLAIVLMAITKYSYYYELTKELKLSNREREIKPRKVVIVKDETK